MNRHQLIRENWEKIIQNIGETCAKYNKIQPEILGACKFIPIEYIKVAWDCGLRLIGENRVQEFTSKKDAYPSGITSDFIGNLQTNKVKYLVGNVRIIHSVDSLKLAQEIAQKSKNANITQRILLEINVGDEATKSGVSESSLAELYSDTVGLDGISVDGFMIIPPFENSEYYFQKAAELFEIYKQKSNSDNFSILSMGMSDTYMLAIKHMPKNASGIVRIGSALFGLR